MKKLIFLFQFLLISNGHTQEINSVEAGVPVTDLFYRLDSHILGSFTDNYGINHGAAIAGSYLMVKSGADWSWYKFSMENGAVSRAGFVSVTLGGFVPIAAPLAFYLYGNAQKSRELQITGLALGQAAMISLAVSSAYKAITARRHPDHEGEETSIIDYSTDFKFGLFNRGVFNGWPSGHTMNAFALAATLIELYPDNETIFYGSLTYAAVIGLGVSTNIHWFSDAFAGALIGYSIGKTVGSGFRKLMNKEDDQQAYQIYFTPASIGFIYRF